MQSKIIFTILIMLSFNIFHDSFITLLEKNEHTHIAHYMGAEVLSDESTEFNKMHSMFHFMAIVDLYTHKYIHPLPQETIAHLLIYFTPPFKKNSYKPPIV